MIDHEKIEQAVRLLLEGMGEDVNREGLIDTPDRIAREALPFNRIDIQHPFHFSRLR